MNTVKVKDSLFREIKSMGLVETDPRKIDEYKTKKLLINNLKDVETLKSDVNDIKAMLREILNVIR